jgi:alpha-D-ribose 1-methylphosphonate 5-triphosphate synthase subunit PhnG
LNAYAEQATLTSHVMERSKRENALLHHGTRESTEKDLELQVAYRCLSEAEHGLNYMRQQIGLTREEVNTCTNAIVHLENAIKA